MGMVMASHLEALKIKHQDLETRIADEERRPHPDDVTLHELKKQKLRVKDELVALERVH
jgi:uncharacterized protein